MEIREHLSITDLVLDFWLKFSLTLSNLVEENIYWMAGELSRSDELPNGLHDTV